MATMSSADPGMTRGYHLNDVTMFFDVDGTPLTVEQADTKLRAKQSDDYGVVGRTDLNLDGVSVRVSTVWLCVNHNFTGTGPPVIFETMVFGIADEIVERYTTWIEAEEGHRRIVEALTDGRLREITH